MSSPAPKEAAPTVWLHRAPQRSTGPLDSPLTASFFHFPNAAGSQLALLEFVKAIASNIHPPSQCILDSFPPSCCLDSSLFFTLPAAALCPRLALPRPKSFLFPVSLKALSHPRSSQRRLGFSSKALSHRQTSLILPPPHPFFSSQCSVLRLAGGCSHLLRFNLDFTNDTNTQFCCLTHVK